MIRHVGQEGLKDPEFAISSLHPQFSKECVWRLGTLHAPLTRLGAQSKRSCIGVVLPGVFAARLQEREGEHGYA